MSTLRHPPYARRFADARAKGFVPRRLGLGHLVAVLDWREPSGGMPRFVFPPDTDPAAFDLGFVAGLHITVNHSDKQAGRVAAVVDALLAAGAAVVEAVSREALARGDGLDAAWPRFEREGEHHAV